MSPAIERVLSRLRNVRRDGTGWNAECPAHEDNRNSLHVAEGRDGRAILHCHAGCPTQLVVHKADLAMTDLFLGPPSENGTRASASLRGAAQGRIVATYDYIDENGTLRYQEVRYEPKNFRVRRPKPGADPGEDIWIWNLDGVARVPYRLPEVRTAVGLQREGKYPLPIFITEGPKDADALTQTFGLTATTNECGAGKWTDEHSAYLAGATDVVVIPDNDGPGLDHAEKLARSLHSKVRSLRVLQLPNLPAKGDVSDWIAAGGTRDELITLAARAPLYSHPVKRFTSIAIGMHAFLNRKIEKPISILGSGVISAFHVAMLVGRGGAGKSWLALMMGRTIARGESFFGLATPEGGVKVGILELEDHAYDYQERLRVIAAASGGSDERDDRLEIVTRPDLQGAVRVGDQGTVDAIGDWIECSELKVLIVDALKDAHDKEENSNQQMAEIMSIFALISSRTGCAILILHHESSKAPADGKERSDVASPRGASALFDNTRCLMRIMVHPNGLRSLVFAKLSHGAPPPPVWLAQDKETGAFTVAEAPEAVKTKNVGKVEEVLREAEPNGLTVEELVKVTKLSKSTIHEHLKAIGAVSNGAKKPRYRPASGSSESVSPDAGISSDSNGLDDYGALASESEANPPSGVRTVRSKERTGRTDARTDSGRSDDQTDFPFSSGAA